MVNHNSITQSSKIRRKKMLTFLKFKSNISSKYKNTCFNNDQD